MVIHLVTATYMPPVCCTKSTCMPVTASTPQLPLSQGPAATAFQARLVREKLRAVEAVFERRGPGTAGLTLMQLKHVSALVGPTAATAASSAACMACAVQHIFPSLDGGTWDACCATKQCIRHAAARAYRA